MPTSDTLTAWWHAVRPHTLPAGAAPVVVGWSLAYRAGHFAPVPALAALAGALLIQVGTNLANDYFDARKGVDDADREGFVRATASGLLSPSTVLAGALIALSGAVVVGIYLVVVGGIPILLVGLLGVAMALLYAGGPVPLGSVGLGDPLVFVFFGPVAVGGTYYVQAAHDLTVGASLLPPAGTLPENVLLAAVPIGCINTAILTVNNLRDLKTDRRARKHTLAVLLGVRGTRIEYTLLLSAAYLVPPIFYGMDGGPWSLAPLASLLLVPPLVRVVWTRRDGEALNPALSRTARLLLWYALLWSLGIVLSTTFPVSSHGLQ